LTRTGRNDALGAAIVLAAALAVVLLQPLDAPWWYHADADATYVANSYELGAGHYTWYLDHPGMPLQDLMAVTFDARYVGFKIRGGAGSRTDFLNSRLLHLDDSRLYFRGFAALFYLAGALIAFWVVRGLLRSSVWGVAAGLLWLGAPGLLEQSIQYRADPPLAALFLLVGFLIARAAERRDALLYVTAAVILGFAITVKIHAVAAVVPFAIAVAFRPPRRPERDAARRRAQALLARFRGPLIVLAALTLALVAAVNGTRLPRTTGPWQYPDGLQTAGEIRRLVIGIAVALGGYTLLALIASRISPRIIGRVFDPFVAVLLWATLAGIALPATLSVRDGFSMLLSIANGLTGHGVNSSSNVTPFAHAWDNLAHWPLQQFVVLFALAVVAAAVAIRRRDLTPTLWAAGAIVAAVFAAARFGTQHYWAPAYVLSIPPALWLCRRGGMIGTVGAVALLAYVLVPAGAHVRTGAHRAERQAQGEVVWDAAAARLLKPGQIALGQPYVAPVADIPYVDLVRLWVEVPPPRSYRFVSAREPGLAVAAAQHAKLAYFFGARALAVRGRTRLELFPGHEYVVEPVPSARRPDIGFGVLRLVHGEGVDEPYGHPNAKYDRAAHLYREGGHTFDFWGNEVASAHG